MKIKNKKTIEPELVENLFNELRGGKK